MHLDDEGPVVLPTGGAAKHSEPDVFGVGELRDADVAVAAIALAMREELVDAHAFSCSRHAQGRAGIGRS